MLSAWDFSIAAHGLLHGRRSLAKLGDEFGDGRVEGFGLVLVEAGALQVIDLAADQGDFIGQNLEGVFDAAHASPAPAL